MGVRLSTMVREVYDLFVEVGRVVFVNDAKADYLATIVDIVDHNRVMVASPSKKRSVVRMSAIKLTPQVLSLRRMSKAKAIKAAFDAADVEGTFAKSSLGRKLAKREARASLNDFGRFKVMVAKKNKNKIVAAELKKLK